MQANTIYIPTDSVEASGDVQSRSQSVISDSPESLIDCTDDDTSRESWPEHSKSERIEPYLDFHSTPQQKLSHSLAMSEEYINEKEIYEAIEELIRCVALTRIIYGDNHWRLAQSFANLAHGYLTLRGLPVQAAQHAESAKEILLNGLAISKSEEDKREILGTLLTIYYTLGVAHLMQNNGRESLQNLQKVEKILKELETLDGVKVARTKISGKDLAIALGRFVETTRPRYVMSEADYLACVLQNKLNLALEYFEKAVDCVIRSEGDSVPELISLYQEMAKAEGLRKKNDRAIEHLLQAYSISVALYSKGSVEAAESGLLLAKAYANSGSIRYVDLADMYFAESLHVYQAAVGADDSQALSTMVEYSKWLVQVGRNQEAYKLLNSACSSRGKTSLDFSETMAEVFHLAGTICLADGKVQKAYKLLKTCLEIQTAVYGCQHKKPRQTQELLNMLQKSATVSEGNKTK